VTSSSNDVVSSISTETVTSDSRKRKRDSEELEADHMVSTLDRKRNQKGYTELHTASENGDFVKVDEILKTNDYSIWIKTNCHNQYTPLHVAIYPQYVALNTHHIKVVKLLLAAGADIDQTAITLAKSNALPKTAAILKTISKMLLKERSRRAYLEFENWKSNIMFTAYVTNDNEF